MYTRGMWRLNEDVSEGKEETWTNHCPSHILDED